MISTHRCMSCMRMCAVLTLSTQPRQRLHPQSPRCGLVPPDSAGPCIARREWKDRRPRRWEHATAACSSAVAGPVGKLSHVGGAPPQARPRCHACARPTATRCSRARRHGQAVDTFCSRREAHACCLVGGASICLTRRPRACCRGDRALRLARVGGTAEASSGESGGYCSWAQALDVPPLETGGGR